MSWISKHVYMCDWRLEDRNKLKGWVCLSVYCICHAFFFIYYHCYLSISYLPIYIYYTYPTKPSIHPFINNHQYIYPLLISKKHKRQWKKLKLLSISRKTPWTPCFNPHFTTPPRVSTNTHTHTHTHREFHPISLPRCVPLSSQLTAVLKTPKFWKRPNVIPKLAAAQKKAPALATYPNDNG